MWVDNLEKLGIHNTNPAYAIITATGALSKILQGMCKKLSVHVISQQITADNNFRREIYLLGDNTPWVHAITTAPHVTYLHFKTELDNLNNKLLGETLLYTQPHTRSSFEYAIVNSIITRRSLFDLQGYKILVQEGFKASFLTMAWSNKYLL